ncbi:SulP family inorganic anion transporter, partial [Desulfobacterales bacterium HSG2]|nr:SulP family inorganic anion transporter [Desulfobacterales bacterium HSG2]
ASPSSLGPVIGTVSFEWPKPDMFLQLFRAKGIGIVIPDLLIPGLVLGLLGATESLLTSVTSDNLIGHRHQSNRELIGQGIGNIVASFFGAISSAGSVPRTTANFRAGGRTPLSGMICSFSLFLMIMAMGVIIEKIPLAVIAGIFIAVGIGLLDKWTINIVRKRKNPFRQHKEALINLLVILTVTAVTVGVNLIAGAGIMVVAVSALFILKKGRPIIRRKYSGSKFHSKKMRTPEQIEILEQEGRQIIIFELQGPVFFDSAETLSREIEKRIKKTTYYILDMRRVSVIDSTGADILLLFNRRLEKDGKYFLLSYLRENRSLWEFLRVMDVIGRLNSRMIFTDTDGALEWAEEHLLACSSQYGGSCAEVSPED